MCDVVGCSYSLPASITSRLWGLDRCHLLTPLMETSIVTLSVLYSRTV